MFCCQLHRQAGARAGSQVAYRLATLPSSPACSTAMRTRKQQVYRLKDAAALVTARQRHPSGEMRSGVTGLGSTHALNVASGLVFPWRAEPAPPCRGRTSSRLVPQSPRRNRYQPKTFSFVFCQKSIIKHCQSALPLILSFHALPPACVKGGGGGVCRVRPSGPRLSFRLAAGGE